MNQDFIVQPEEFQIEGVFKDAEYVIPIYQRNYSWTDREIEQLINDVYDTSDKDGGKYYLGSLIVNHTGTNVYEVIDGQQRLTTLFLLLCYLKSDFVTKHSLRFEAREKSNKTLQDIKAIEDKEKVLEKEPWYSAEIIEGYSVIKKYFEGKDEEYKRVFRKKLSHIILIRTQVPKDIDLNHYFEIMNTRGEQLEIHEIVKAKVLGAIKTGDVITEEDRKDGIIAAEIWDACSQMDKYVQMNFTPQVREALFDQNWDSFACKSFDDLRERFQATEDENKKHDSDDETKYELKNILNGTKGGSKNNEDTKKEETERFESIISFPNFILQVNEALNLSETDNDAGLDDKKFIELMQDNWQTKEKALFFIYSLLKYRFLFDRSVIKREYIGQYKVEGKWSLQRLKMYIDSSKSKKPSYKATIGDPGETDDIEVPDNKKLRMLQACLRITYTSPKTMHWIARTLHEVDAKRDGTSLTRLLEEYACKKIIEADYKNRKGFSVERIVFSYLDYVLWRDNEDEFKDFQFQFRNSIEHFYPQNPINKENAVDEKNRDSFGNLALITVSANSKFSNMLPSHKADESPEIINQSPKLVRMKQLLFNNNRIWNDATVDRHYADMMAILDNEINQH